MADIVFCKRIGFNCIFLRCSNGIETTENHPVSASHFITIFQCDSLSYDAPNLHLRVCCSKGTYIRSLAHDIGEKLNCGGHLSQLRRTRSGDFSVTQALPLDTLLQEPTLLKQYLITAEGTDRQ
jgi:tRNA pseudouridine(55) synthase